jgi:glutamine amidotransferase PdxT
LLAELVQRAHPAAVLLSHACQLYNCHIHALQLLLHDLHHVQVSKPSDITSADKLIFPGVGTFGQAMDVLQQRDYVKPLVDYIQVGAAAAAAAAASPGAAAVAAAAAAAHACSVGSR